MGNPVVYFEVIGADHEKLSSFFGDLFDWEITPAGPGNYNFVEPGDDSVRGGIGAAPGYDYVTFYVAVDDLQATLDRVQQLGGKTAMEPTNVGEGIDVAMFEDPEGHRIGLIKS